MLRNLLGIPIRILVTGARGKSSLVRLLHSALCACGLETRSRITGVIPRELSCGDFRMIQRNAPAHISEMKWWLEQIPMIDAIVVENSAVSPELQPVAMSLMSPTLVVWTNCRPDHEEAWGPGRKSAVEALLAGIPRNVPVAGGTDIDDGSLPHRLSARGNTFHRPLAISCDMPDYKKENISLASAACEVLKLPSEKSFAAMSSLAPDIADFGIIDVGGKSLAAAFSANDTLSTEKLFLSTGWKPEETTLLYHHRVDRAARLKSFKPWIESHNWSEAVYTRNAAGLTMFSSINWLDVKSIDAFKKWCETCRTQYIFGCGNVAGWPLDFLLGLHSHD